MCKNQCVCFNKTTWSMTMKMILKVKNRSYSYEINRPRLRHGRKYTKYKMWSGTIMVICINPFITGEREMKVRHERVKQHLRNIWSSIHEKVIRCGSRTAATSKMELFVTIANGFQSLTISTKFSILDVEAVLYPPLIIQHWGWLEKKALLIKKVCMSTSFSIRNGFSSYFLL